MWAILIRDFPPEINCSWISAEQNHRTTGNIVGFLRGYWGNLRIPREDCGNLKGAMGRLGNHRPAVVMLDFEDSLHGEGGDPSVPYLNQPTNQPTNHPISSKMRSI